MVSYIILLPWDVKHSNIQVIAEEIVNTALKEWVEFRLAAEGAEDVNGVHAVWVDDDLGVLGTSWVEVFGMCWQ